VYAPLMGAGEVREKRVNAVYVSTYARTNVRPTVIAVSWRTRKTRSVVSSWMVNPTLARLSPDTNRYDSRSRERDREKESISARAQAEDPR